MSEDNRFTDGGGFANGGQMIIKHPADEFNDQIAALQGEIAVYKGSLQSLNEQLAAKDRDWTDTVIWLFLENPARSCELFWKWRQKCKR